MYSPELSSKIALWRQKTLDGTMTVEEYREAIAALREGRLSAMQSGMAAKSAKATKVKKAAISGDDLLDELEGL